MTPIYPDYELNQSIYENDSSYIGANTLLRIFRNEKYYLVKLRKNHVISKEQIYNKEIILLEFLRRFHQEVYLAYHLSIIPEKEMFDIFGNDFFPVDDNQTSEQERLKKYFIFPKSNK